MALFSFVEFLLNSVHYHYVVRKVAAEKARQPPTNTSHPSSIRYQHTTYVHTLPMCQNSFAQISSASGEFGRFLLAAAYLHTQRSLL